MAIRPIYERLSTDPGSSFLFRNINRDKRALLNDGVWHYHPEYELVINLKSYGKRFVGYDISDYYKDDLVLIGEYVPHCWITEQQSEQLVINFRKEFLGKELFLKPELQPINRLLESSKKGICFGPSVSSKAKKEIIKLGKANGLDRLIRLLKLLSFLSQTEDYHYLTNYNTPTNNESLKASKRIELVHTFILNNYRKEATLDQLSDELHMNKTSLCKFIKKYTKKTFQQLLNETRVSLACRLLTTTDKYVSQISYECGYKNLSNFNRSFKKVMDRTPVEYRRNFTR